MSTQTKKEVLAKLCLRYAHAGPAYKSKPIDQLVELFGLHRKSAICALRRTPRSPSVPALLGRPVEYRPAQLLPILKPIWLASQQPCGKRLVAALPDWLPFYEDEYRRLNRDTRQQLLSASATTPWEVTRPGFLELDTVALCGGSLQGDFTWMLDSVDFCSQWVEAHAVWNKSWYNTLEQWRDFEMRLPFALLGLDHDNGGELLNALTTGVWGQLLNYFCPVMKLQRKVRDGSRVRCQYDTAATPYARLLAQPQVAAKTKALLRTQRAKLNPFELNRQIEKQLKTIFAMARRPN